MAQLHCVYAGFSPVRPTNDIDIVLHIEKIRGLPAAAARSSRSGMSWRCRSILGKQRRTVSDGRAPWLTCSQAATTSSMS
jgi:hypothetical protein